MPMGLDEAYLNITEYLEERKNWHEDKRKYIIKPHRLAVNGKQLLEVPDQKNILLWFHCVIL